MQKRQQKKLVKKEKKIQKRKQKQLAKHQQKGQPRQQLEDDDNQIENIDFNNQLQEQIIDFSFLITQIQQQYYHSFKTILQRYSQLTNINSSEIASAILQNKTIGNASINEEDEDQQEEQEQDNQLGDQDQFNTFSVLSLLPCQKKIGTKIKSLFTKSLQTHIKVKKQQYIQCLNKPCSVLINERVRNMPGFVGEQSHVVFAKDLKQLEKKNSKQYNEVVGQYILILTEVQKEKSDKLEDLLFTKFEDFEFAKNSKVWWIGESSPVKSIKADFRKLYIIISRKDYLKATNELNKYIQ